MGPDTTFNGYLDSFVAKINESGLDIEFCGYIGGKSREGVTGIKVSDSQYLYATGWTYSDETSFPVLVGPDLTHNGGGDAFVAKLNTKLGCFIEYCGYIGGVKSDFGFSIDIDSDENVYVLGTSTSNENSFPVIKGPDLTHNGMTDGFIARLNRNETSLAYCGYFGGKNSDFSRCIRTDLLGNIYLMGYTESPENSFPIQIGPDLTFNDRIYMTSDIFISKLLHKGLYCSSYNLPTQGINIEFYLDAGVRNANRVFLIIGGLNNKNPGSLMPGGFIFLPFMLDHFSINLAQLINSQILLNFYGTLDNNGCGRSQMKINKLRPEFIGLNLYFAFCLNYPFDYVSNPVVITITD